MPPKVIDHRLSVSRVSISLWTPSYPIITVQRHVLFSRNRRWRFKWWRHNVHVGHNLIGVRRYLLHWNRIQDFQDSKRNLSRGGARIFEVQVNECCDSAQAVRVANFFVDYWITKPLLVIFISEKVITVKKIDWLCERDIKKNIFWPKQPLRRFGGF